MVAVLTLRQQSSQACVTSHAQPTLRRVVVVPALILSFTPPTTPTLLAITRAPLAAMPIQPLAKLA